MLRQSIVKIARNSTPLARRPFSVAAIKMGEGDTGAPRSGGVASSDSWTKREEANETRFIKEKEREKLKALREKIAAQRKHLDELDQHIEELHKESGGEQH